MLGLSTELIAGVLVWNDVVVDVDVGLGPGVIDVDVLVLGSRIDGEGGRGCIDGRPALSFRCCRYGYRGGGCRMVAGTRRWASSCDGGDPAWFSVDRRVCADPGMGSVVEVDEGLVEGLLLLPLSGFLEFYGSFSVDGTRDTNPATPFLWYVAVDDVKAGSMAPARAVVAGDGKPIVVGETADAADGLAAVGAWDARAGRMWDLRELKGRRLLSFQR